MTVIRLNMVSPLEVSEAYMKMQNFFFDRPTEEYGLNDLCMILRISKTTANIVVTQLIKEGFLRREIIGRVWRIANNPHHDYNISRKVPYHLSMIQESGIREAVHSIVPNARTIILFGSYRKGDDNEKSDVDIAVEVIGNEGIRIEEIGTIRRLGYRENVKVNLHIFSRSNINLNLFANIANGIVLDGFLEVRP